MDKASSSADRAMLAKLQEREAINALRSLTENQGLIDFCSNDYLGFARDKDLQKTVLKELSKSDHFLGSTGSRLLTGNSEYVLDLERFIANYHKAEAGLIFNSGYDANIGLFSSIGQKGDTIIYDEYSHASIIAGIRLSKSESYPFRHNDTAHLEERLKIAKGTIYVAVESVYSMDGDFSSLQKISELCSKFNAHLIVDEAHATGLFGAKGEGRVVELGIEEKVFARVHTFGKALGCHGAIVLGSELLRNYLINFAGSFIYTTALPKHSLLGIKYAYDKLSNEHIKILKTSYLVDLFKSKFKDGSDQHLLASESLIQCVIIPGNERVKFVAAQIQNKGFDVRPILSPTVPKNKERLRICLHAFNTEKEISGLAESLKNLDLFKR